ncbi:MAG: cell division protein SepF [Cyanobacteriota bacterium]|nr:cell division protein SepF [Cyanobacteriota bacterium]
MSGLWGRVKDFVGWTDPVDGLEDYSEMADQEDYQSLFEQSKRHPQASQAAMSSEGAEEPASDYGQGMGTRPRRQRSTEWSEATHRRTNRERSLGNNMASNVIGLPSVNSATSEVVVMDPRSFDEMAQVVQNLRDRKTVIMNLTLMDPADAQRSVDFVAGGTYAIDGHQERIGENIFLFTPSTVAVTTSSSYGAQPTQRTMPSPTSIWSAVAYDPVHAVGQR